jgi:cytochrome c biogenesis protein
MEDSTTVNERMTATATNWVDLLGSMRFAISSLSILSVASIIGTLLIQREPFVNYVNQFGPFWAQMFEGAGIYEVYNAWWFLLVLTFLVASTSLCVFRNSPKMIREMRAWRESIRSQSLKSMRFNDELITTAEPTGMLKAQEQLLKQLGYKTKRDERSDGMMLAGKRGASNRLGYIFAHVGIVVVCLGGLLDSELPLKITTAFLHKTPIAGTPSDELIPASGKLPEGNPSYRANLFVPEGGRGGLATINVKDGRYIQELPFIMELKQFRVEYYSTGMPKLFASEVIMIDRETGARSEATIKVNEPLLYKGVAIYQSSFDDGGSQLKLKSVALDGRGRGVEVPVEVGGTAKIDRAGSEPLRLEVNGFRAINVENTAQTEAVAADKKFKDSVASVLSPSAGGRSKGLRNVGPSVQYRLRDPAGQAREYNVYMLPVDIEGHPMFLAGMRTNASDQFQYLRIPADAKGELTEFSRIRTALNDPVLIRQAAVRFAEQSAPKQVVDGQNRIDGKAAEQLSQSTERALQTFSEGGLQSVAEFIEKNVPKAEQERASEMVLRVLSSGMWELWQASRAAAGLPALEFNQDNTRFLQLAQVAISDTFVFGTPLFFQLSEFKEIKASVFQVTRSPGKKIVYLGSLLLVLGVFAMFYIRERRVWCWITPNSSDTHSGQSKVQYAMSSTRKSLTVDQDFAKLQKLMQDTYANHATQTTH